MAARKSSTLHPRHRDAIKTAMLIKQLQGYALYLTDPSSGKPFEMTKGRITVALGLLRKTMPDLLATTLSTAPGVAAAFVIFGQAEAADADAWQRDNPVPA